MKNVSVVLRSILIFTVFSGFVYGTYSSENPDLVEQTIEVIKDCMAKSPAPWPEEWKKEYINTIRKAIMSYQDAPHYAVRLKILHNGFQTCWEDLTKNKDRSLFEMCRARIRWYIEHLMSTEFPSDEERQKLRDQYEDLWDHAASSLLKQFPFLDPNAVQAAKADELSQCYLKIDAPLMPVYLRPMSEEQVEQIKQRWDKLRYAHVDLLLRLDNDSTMPMKKNEITLSNKKRDYELTKESQFK